MYVLNTSYIVTVRSNTSEKHILKIHILVIYDGNKYYKCETCDKIYIIIYYLLKRNIKIIYESQNNYKFQDFCKSFSRAGTLKIHIIHEGHKDKTVNLVANNFLKLEL